jgi:SAM-dependent methyltransferase
MARAALRPERDLAGRGVLEAACGRGGFALWLAQLAPPPRLIVALDLARGALLQGRGLAERQRLDVDWIAGDVGELPFAGRCFDTLFSFETLEHVPRPRQALAELVRVLRPGGRLFLSTPNYFNVWGLYRIYLRLRGRRFAEAGQPINQPLLLPLTVAWVRRAGLAVESVETRVHSVPSGPGRPAREVPWLAGLGPARRWLGQQALIVARRLE